MAVMMRKLSPGAETIDIQHPVTIGNIGQAYGVKGWVKINSFTEPKLNILNYETWALKYADGFEAITIIEAKAHGKGIIAHIEGCNDRTQAQQYTGLELVISRDQLPALEEGEYYIADFEGMAVQTEQGVSLGTVDYVMETGANDVLVIRGEKQRLIPFVEDHYIKNIDAQARIITVDWDPEF